MTSTPSFKFGKVELFNIDCMEYLAAQPDKSFDLAIVDPPYGIGECGATNKSRAKLAQAKDYKPFFGGDASAPVEEYFIELCRVSKHQIIWGANHFIDRLAIKNSSCWVVWDKENGESDFADCELAWTSFPSAVRLFRYRWSGMLQGDMKNKELRIHPTQKPIKLYQWLLSKYAKNGWRILDTHLGSGSNAIASYYAGFDFVGCEIDRHYYEEAKKRFELSTAQMVLL